MSDVTPSSLDNENLATALKEAAELGSSNTPATKNVEPKQSESADETPPKSNEPSDEEKLKERLALLEKRLRDKDSYIGKQRSELDKVKKQLENLAIPPKPTNDEFFEDPTVAQEKLEQHRKAKEQKAALEQQQQTLELMDQRRATVLAVVPDFENKLSEVRKLLVEQDGLADDVVSNYLSMPYAADPVALIQLAKRAEMQTTAAALKAENEQLKERISKLEKKPNKLLSNVDRATRNGPPVSSKSGSSKTGDSTADISIVQRAAMSNADLEEALKNAAKEQIE